jgi:hypothetical protein
LVSPDPLIFQGEYLLDVIWQNPAPCADLLLACESEWGDCGSVCEDFEKLMHVKAPLKLMIFCTGDHEKDFLKIRKGIELKYMAEFTQQLPAPAGRLPTGAAGSAGGGACRLV